MAAVLVMNAGSTSVKLALVDDDEAVTTIDSADEAPAGLAAVGHRIVHGGERFSDAVRVDAQVVAALHDLADLAPLHQEKSLRALDEAQAALPDVPHVACFDTAFHATLPDAAATYALPADWRDRWELRRYGFHGLAHASVLHQIEQPGRTPERLVNCHLGSGASLCAIRAGRSVDTTMGFTPLEGLVMATRSGSVDPGLILWLLERAGVSTDEMARTLEHESGLLALAGTADMEAIVAGRRAGDAKATLAFDVYVHRVRAGIGAMAASLGGIDVLSFSGGVGENSEAVRDAVVDGLGFLGAQPEVMVVEAREDLEIARGVSSLVGA